MRSSMSYFFFNDTATTEIYTLSLHDALPILSRPACRLLPAAARSTSRERHDCCDSHRNHDRLDSHDGHGSRGDRKSTRLNSSHANISYAVFCLKKKTSHSFQTRYLHISTMSP